MTRADCLLIAAGTKVPPGVRLYGSDALDLSRLPAQAADRVEVTLPLDLYPPFVAAFFAAYRADFGGDDPDAILGFEAMRLALGVIEISGMGTRADVQRAVDTQATSAGFGVYRLRGGKLVFARRLDR